MQYFGLTLAKKLLVVYSKFKLDLASYIYLANYLD